MMKKLTRDTYIRDLPFSAIRHLAMELDNDKLWEKLLENIPHKLDSDSEIFQPRYTAQQAKIFEQKLRIASGSPTRSILDDWGTQNSTVGHLIQVLMHAELIAAANYLRTDVLQEKQVVAEPDRMPIQDVFLPPGLLPHNAVPSQYPDQVVPAVCGGLDLPYGDPCASKLTDTIPGQREGEQNDLSLHSGPSTKSSNISDGPKSHHGAYSSYGGMECLAQASPNINLSVETDKRQGKSAEKKIDEELLQVQSTPFSRLRMQKGLPPVINQKEHLQHISYEDLSEITDNFNEVPYEDGGRLIGKGGFGMVHLAIDRDERKAAVKVLLENKDNMEPKNKDNMQQKQFQAEINTLSMYQHENILPLFGYSCDGPRPCIVCEFMSNGSLEDRLACKNNTPSLSASLRISITQGTARGIVFLNSHKQIHRDIKTANILLDKDFSPKLGDFATTRVGPMGTGATVAETSTVIGTSVYLAPEALTFDVSAKLDSYSFGVVLLEVITGLPAYDGSREDKALKSHMLENCDDIMTMVDKKAGDWPQASVRSLYDVAEKCLRLDKKARVLVEEVWSQIEKL